MYACVLYGKTTKLDFVLNVNYIKSPIAAADRLNLFPISFATSYYNDLVSPIEIIAVIHIHIHTILKGVVCLFPRKLGSSHAVF